MSKIEELKAKARHEIDTPGHPDYGKSIYTFKEDELEEYARQFQQAESTDIKELIENAHMAGQHNQGHCDPSYYEAQTYFIKEVKPLLKQAESTEAVSTEVVKDELIEAKKEIDKLKFMINNGLGWDDMKNDIQMPHEI